MDRKVTPQNNRKKTFQVTKVAECYCCSIWFDLIWFGLNGWYFYDRCQQPMWTIYSAMPMISAPKMRRRLRRKQIEKRKQIVSTTERTTAMSQLRTKYVCSSIRSTVGTSNKLIMMSNCRIIYYLHDINEGSNFVFKLENTVTSHITYYVLLTVYVHVCCAGRWWKSRRRRRGRRTNSRTSNRRGNSENHFRYG